MNRFDRIYALHRILRDSRYPVSRKAIQERLECSRATFTRIVEDMRDFLCAPIVYDRERNGYYYADSGEHPYELPGLWFNASEIHALLACQELLKNVEPGLLDQHIKPLRDRIDEILSIKQLATGDVSKRIKILRMTYRTPPEGVFQVIAEATAQRRRVNIFHHGRERGQMTEREVSPQRLVYYRDNWYLDGWCHLRDGLRTFSMDRIRVARVSARKTKNVSGKALDEYFARSYGIFAGKPKGVAHLRFSENVSPWVATERWHPEQEMAWSDERLELKIPYSDPRELVQDILKHGEDVKVIGPPELKMLVIERLSKASSQYR
ncbi:MAG: helix-turn-helix transcriptional regulator [Candidatus Nitrospinota bacterium M3_3B_026]